MTSLFLILKQRFAGEAIETNAAEDTTYKIPWQKFFQQLLRLVKNGIEKIINFFLGIDNWTRRSKISLILPIGIIDIVLALVVLWINYLGNFISGYFIAVGEHQSERGDNFLDKGMPRVAEENYLQANYWYDMAAKVESHNKPKFSKNTTNFERYLRAHYKLGEVNEKLGNYDAAIRHYKIAEKGGKDDVGVLIARTYMRQKKFDLADDWLWTILESRGQKVRLKAILESRGETISSEIDKDHYLAAPEIINTLAHYHFHNNDCRSARSWLDLGLDVVHTDNKYRVSMEKLSPKVQCSRSRSIDGFVGKAALTVSPDAGAIAWVQDSYRNIA
ncbi:MAG: tetratricopeptide repeat protein [Cyanobacteria bacterium P01_F01_bin.116]